MDNKLYEELIRNFCKAAGIADVIKVLETHEIVIEDRTFAFFYNDEIAGQDFVIYVDIPFLKQNADAFFYRALLEANYLWEKTGGTTLGLHPERDSLGLAIKLAVTDPDGQMLYTAVQHLDQLAKSWQEAISAYFQSKADSGMPAGTAGMANRPGSSAVDEPPKFGQIDFA